MLSLRTILSVITELVPRRKLFSGLVVIIQPTNSSCSFMVFLIKPDIFSKNSNCLKIVFQNFARESFRKSYKHFSRKALYVLITSKFQLSVWNIIQFFQNSLVRIFWRRNSPRNSTTNSEFTFETLSKDFFLKFFKGFTFYNFSVEVFLKFLIRWH